MIRLTGINKSFGAVKVLNDIDLTIREGTVTALIGPSGGGKSTLLRCVNLLELPQEGSVSVGDIEISFGPHIKPHKDKILDLRRKTGMVFQAFNLFPNRTALQNIIEGLITVLGWGEGRAKKRGVELLDKVGLAHKAAAYPAELSGGQQQRIAIARALAHSPEVLLCDEPTSALDPELAAEVVAVLKALADEKVTMAIATHDFRFAASIAEEIVFLEQGRIIESGKPRELFLNPKHERTSMFVATSGLAPFAQ
jgi:cystine transport system ATP-binding protein